MTIIPIDDSFVRRSLLAALAVVAAVILASWVLLAVAHASDRYGIGWVQGAWMALAKYADAGVLYPPLYDGHSYGGTRFMPVPIILHAVGARITKEYLLSGKLVGYFSFLLLLVLIFVVLRKLGCPMPVALAFTSLTIVTNTGFLAATRIQGDALPVFFQLAAVGTVTWFSGRRSTIAAAALSVLGLLSKISAMWAPLAISLWLLARDRRRLLPYATSFLVLFLASLGAFQMISKGRMLTNIFALAFSGVGGISALLQSPYLLLWQISSFAQACWALLPLSLIGGIVSIGRREVEIFYLSLACELVVMLVVVADEGVAQNHLIDLVVLVAVTAGALWCRVGSDSGRLPLMSAAMATIVVWIAGTSFALTMGPDVKAALKLVVRRQADPDLVADPMAGHIGPHETVLAEDPYVPVSLGQFPVVLDAWMLLRIGRQNPEWMDSLARRIEAREFDKVVLARPLEGYEDWYKRVHFGQTISDAIRRNYRFSEKVVGYYLYVPTGGR